MTFVEDQLICKICQNTLQHPRSLKCLHSFCSTCIFEYVRESSDERPVGCPVCKLEVFSETHNTDNIQSFVNNLPENKILKTLLNRCTQDYLEASVTDYKCSLHESTLLSKYCKTCHSFICDWCLPQDHQLCQTCGLDAIENLYRSEVSFLLQEFRNVESDINSFYNTLLPKARELLISKEDMSLEISKYFSDIKHKFEQYILNQQREVQKRFTQIVDKERKRMVHDRNHCHALLGSIEEKYSKYSSVPRNEVESEEASKNLFFLSTLGRELDDYKSIARKLRSENHGMPDMRFIINTDFEDSLTNTNLISVEILNSRREGETVEHVDGTPQERHAPGDEIPRNHALPPVPPRTNIPQEEQQRDNSPTPTDPNPPNTSNTNELPDEPPPPYPGPTQRRRRSRRRTSRNSSRQSHPCPSAPPLVQNPPLDPSVIDIPASATNMDYSDGISVNHIPRNVYLHQQCKLTTSSGLDKYSPVIVGLVWIDLGMVIALDKRNQLLKQLNLRTFQVSHCLRVPGQEPWDITGTIPFQSAIVVPRQRKIILTMNSRVEMSVLQNVTTQKPYSAISYNKKTGDFICGCIPQFAEPCIDILDANGVLKISLENDTYSNKITEYPRALSVCENHVLFSDFKKKQVRSIDLNTNSIDIYRGRKMLKEPYGLACMESRNLLFLTDSDSDVLHVINKYTEEVTIAEPNLGVGHPGNIAIYESVESLRRPNLAIAFRNGVVVTYEMELL